jgi:hypothetical protein
LAFGRRSDVFDQPDGQLTLIRFGGRVDVQDGRQILLAAAAGPGDGRDGLIVIAHRRPLETTALIVLP